MILRWRYGLAAAAMVLTASAGHAQQHALGRGSIQVGGSASLTSTGSDDDDDRVTNAAVNPRLHYFVAERLAVGADLTVTYRQFTDEFSSWTLGFGPSVTYYFGAPQRHCTRNLSARATFASVHVDTPLQDNDSSLRSGSAGAGILTMLSHSVGLTTELFYLILRQKTESAESDVNTFGLAIGIAAFVF